MLLALVVLTAFGRAVFVTFRTVPARNTSQQAFDTLIVLGSPSNEDGTPAIEQQVKIARAVEEYRQHRAPHLIVTGGAAHNRWVEAEVEARMAVAAGVPEPDVLVEGQSQDTVENIANSWQMMQTHGWKTAEVITVAPHVPRSALLLKHYEPQGLRWRVVAAPLPASYTAWHTGAIYTKEALKTALVRWFGIKAKP